jgi:hypothetical protein
MKVLLVVVLFLATACVAIGQVTKVTEPMLALNFLVGKWEGKVTYAPGVQQHNEVSWASHVYQNIGGSIFIIDEKGSEIDNKNKTTIEVLLVVYWDSAAKAYPARLFWSTKDGAGSVEARGHVEDNILVLQTSGSSMVSRYTIKLNEKGQWYEIGEIRDDSSGSWRRGFEMTLNRQD